MDFSDIDKFDDRTDSAECERSGCFGSVMRFGMIATGLVLAAAVLLAYALTTDLGRLWLLNKVNRSIAPAQLRIETWQMGILTPVVLSGVELDLPEHGVQLRAPQVRFSKGVLGLLPLGKLNLGDVEFSDPLVVIDPSTVKNVTKGPEAETAEGGFFMPVADVGGQLSIRNGTLIVKDNGSQIFVTDRVEGQLLVDSFWKPFGFKVESRTGSGRIALTADLQSMYKLCNGADADYQDKLVLQLEQVDLAAFAALVKMGCGRDLLYAGMAEGALTVERTGATGARIEGGLLIDRLQLVTGAGEYSPAGNTALMIDAQVADDRWLFKRFDFNSPWLTAKLQGALQRVADNRLVDGEISADLDADLAAIARDFRYALAINDDFRIDKGRLKGALKISSSESIRVESDLVTTQLAMRYKGHPIVLERNPSLSFKAVFAGNQMPEVEELKFNSSFADIYGKGRVEQGVLKGYVDLTQFYRDFGGLLSSESAFSGAVHFDFSTKPTGEDVLFNLMTKFSKIKVTLRGGGSSSVNAGSLRLGGSVAGLTGPGGFQALSFRDADFDFRVMESSVTGKLDRYVPVQGDEELPVLRGCTVSCDIRMIDAVNAAGAFMTQEKYREAVGWKGHFLANLAAESANGVAKLRLNGAGTGVDLAVAGKKIADPDLRFAAAVTLDAGKRTLVIREGVLASTVAQISVPEWIVTLAREGEGIRFEGSADAAADMALLYPLLAGEAAGYDQVRGDLKLKLKAQSAATGTELELSGGMTDFYLLADNEIAFFQRQAALSGNVLIAKDGESAHIKSLQLYSDLADIAAEGRLERITQGCVAELRGELDFKFDMLEKLLKLRGIDEWRMTGHKKSAFRLKGPLTEGVSGFLQQGEFSGGAYLASLNGLGLSAGGADIAFALEQSRLKCDWQPVLNGGQLNFNPRFDFGAHAAVMSLPAGVQLLKGVKINQQVFDNLIVHLNPVFHGSKVHKGAVDLKIISFRSGGDQRGDTLFLDADIVLNDLDMELSPAMRELLAMIHVRSTSYRVKQLPMHVVIRNERVHIDPVTMVFSAQPVTFSGSVGFDSTIKYLIEIPISEAIAAKTGLKIPKGLTVKVPVTGTVEQPRLDTSALENAVGDFLKKTIGEETMRGVGDFLQQLKEELRK